MTPPIENTQARIFCVKVLPSLFHGTPNQCLGFLNRDGTKFLRFYWDEAGKGLPEHLRRDTFGLNYVIREPAAYTAIALISLPQPQIEGESYFSALIYRPNRRLWFVSDMTKVINLEMTPSDDPSRLATRLVEITPRLEREVLSKESVEPRLEEFYQALLRQLD